MKKATFFLFSCYFPLLYIVLLVFATYLMMELYNSKTRQNRRLSPNSATNCRRFVAEIGDYSLQCGQGLTTQITAD